MSSQIKLASLVRKISSIECWVSSFKLLFCTSVVSSNFCRPSCIPNIIASRVTSSGACSILFIVVLLPHPVINKMEIKVNTIYFNLHTSLAIKTNMLVKRLQLNTDRLSGIRRVTPLDDRFPSEAFSSSSQKPRTLSFHRRIKVPRQPRSLAPGG